MAAVKKVDVINVVRHGEQIEVPPSMSLSAAIAVLQRQEKYEEEQVVLRERIDGFIWDAAIAMHKAMLKKFGYANAETQKSFWGDKPPQLINIESGIGEVVSVPWGKFSLPGVDGAVYTGVDKKEDGSVVFALSAEIKRKHTDVIKDLARLTREILAKESIYRGKAVRMDFSGGEASMPKIGFVDLRQVNAEQLIFSHDVQRQIETNLFTPLTKTESVIASGIPLKRGVLLAGKYGTGKTLAAMVMAKIATENSWTFIYINSADELSNAIHFAKLYEPAVIFSEDIDRAATAERTDEANEILNTLDGILSKNSRIMVVLTTNHVEKINQAMFRPGRLDAVITINPPDAEAVRRLIYTYAPGQIREKEDLTDACNTLAGQIPAIIRECVERSKLYAISIATQEELRQAQGKPKITAEAILDAALGMTEQLKLLAPVSDVTIHPGQLFADHVADTVIGKIDLDDIADTIADKLS